MRRFSYLLKRLIRIDFGRLFRTLKQTSKKSGRSTIYIAFDMLRCAVVYLAAPADYALFEFYNLTKRQRKTFVTRGINDKLVKKYNDKSLWHVFDNKDEFNTVFSKYIGRKWLKLHVDQYEEFSNFVSDKEVIFYKPLSLSCGWGIEKIKLKEHEDKKTLFLDLCSRGDGLVEEQIIQHNIMAKLYPGSVNTVRLVTINNGKEVAVVFAFLRVGNGRVVDNLNSGGMAAPIDPVMGIVTHPAADKDFKAYEVHPETGTAFVGFEIPRFHMAVETVKEAALIVPQMGYVGWDISITPDSLCFVEANSYPGHDILQLPPHVPNKIGLMERIERFL